MIKGEIAVERTDDGLAVVSMAGEHDLNTAPELRSRLEALAEGGDGVVLDMSPASFVDSSILGVVIDCRRQAGEDGRRFDVVHDGKVDAVDRVLEITGLRRELPIHTSQDEAAAASG